MKIRKTPFIIASVIFFNLLGSQKLSAGTDLTKTDLTALEIGDYVPELHKRRLQEPFIVQRLTDKTYAAFVGGSSATFYVGKKAVLVLDTAEKRIEQQLVSAIRSVTHLPITTLVYSHYHVGHSDGGQALIDDAKRSGRKLEIVSLQAVAEEIERYGNKFPAPTKIFKGESAKFRFEGMKVQIYLPKLGGGHTPDNSVIYLPEQGVLHFMDLVHPEVLLPFFRIATDIPAMRESLHGVLDLDWDYLNAGHGNIGSKRDVEELLVYLDDLEEAVKQALRDEPFGTYINPNLAEFVWFSHHNEAIINHVKYALKAKYGHLPGFDVVVGSHALTMKEYLTVL